MLRKTFSHTIFYAILLILQSCYKNTDINNYSVHYLDFSQEIPALNKTQFTYTRQHENAIDTITLERSKADTFFIYEAFVTNRYKQVIKHIYANVHDSFKIAISKNSEKDSILKFEIIDTYLKIPRIIKHPYYQPDNKIYKLSYRNTGGIYKYKKDSGLVEINFGNNFIYKQI